MGREELTNPRDRLPEMKLPVAGGERSESVLPAGRRRPVVLLLHGSCDRCRDFAGRLDAKAIQAGGGAVRIVVPEAAEISAPSPALVLEDDGRLASAIRVAIPAVVVADEWGEIHFRHEAGEDHAFPEPAAITEWLDHLATVCPECEGEAY